MDLNRNSRFHFCTPLSSTFSPPLCKSSPSKGRINYTTCRPMSPLNFTAENCITFWRPHLSVATDNNNINFSRSPYNNWHLDLPSFVVDAFFSLVTLANTINRTKKVKLLTRFCSLPVAFPSAERRVRWHKAQFGIVSLGPGLTMGGILFQFKYHLLNQQ